MLHLVEFLKSEDGAVTVDWVVLTAAIVGLGIAVVAQIAAGATDMSTSVGATLTAAQPAELIMPLVN